MFVYPVCVVPTKATESHQAPLITGTKGRDSLGGCWASNEGSTSSASTPCSRVLLPSYQFIAILNGNKNHKNGCGIYSFLSCN